MGRVHPSLHFINVSKQETISYIKQWVTDHGMLGDWKGLEDHLFPTCCNGWDINYELFAFLLYKIKTIKLSKYKRFGKSFIIMNIVGSENSIVTKPASWPLEPVQHFTAMYINWGQT